MACDGGQMIEIYDLSPGETPLTHRAFRIGTVMVHVFEGQASAEKFAQANDGDITVLVRHRTMFMRRGESALTVNLNHEANPKHGHVLAAAQVIASEIEAIIKREREAA